MTSPSPSGGLSPAMTPEEAISQLRVAIKAIASANYIVGSLEYKAGYDDALRDATVADSKLGEAFAVVDSLLLSRSGDRRDGERWRAISILLADMKWYDLPDALSTRSPLGEKYVTPLQLAEVVDSINAIRPLASEERSSTGREG